MSMPIDIFWHSIQLSPLPILEFYAHVQDSLMITKYVDSYYLYAACKMIKRIEKYNGIIIEPQLPVPNNKQNIFFTAQFKSYNDLNKFLDSMGWKRIG